MMFTPQQIFSICSNTGGRVMWRVQRRRNCKQDFGWETRKICLIGCPRHRWEENIKIYLKLGGDGGNWTNPATQRDNLRTHLKAKKLPGSKIGGEFIECLRNNDTLSLNYLFLSCRSKSLKLFILSHKKNLNVRATLIVDESYKADGTQSILRGGRV